MGERMGSGERGSWKDEVEKEAACVGQWHPCTSIGWYIIDCSTFCTSYCLTIISYVRSTVYWSPLRTGAAGLTIV